MKIFKNDKEVIIQISTNDAERLFNMAESYDYKVNHREDVSHLAEDIKVALDDYKG
jgi:hypothetical protein